MNIWLAEVWQTWRASLRRPGFLLLAAGVLALGVGSASAVFTLIDGVLLRPLPYPQPHRLVAIGSVQEGGVQAVSPQQYQHLAGLPGVGSLGLFKDGQTATNISGHGEPVQVPALEIDHGLLPTLGVQPALGRNFSAQEDQPHAAPVVMLYHGFWLRRFGGDPSVVGQAMEVEGVAHTIVGVLPAGFDLGQADIALPTAFPAHSQDDGTNYTAVARLAPGATARMLGTQVDTRLHALYAASSNKYWRHEHFGAQDFGAQQHADQRSTALMWLACASLLLLIAMVNLTNLMMLRAMRRSHDASVRGALGASPWRVALPSVAEGVLAGVIGVLLGQGLAALGLGAVRSWMPDGMAAEWVNRNGPGLGWQAWGLAAAVGMFGALVATALGLWRGRAALSMDSLREGGRSGLDRRSGLVGRMLVIAQVALASLLLCTAGVFLHTLLDNARVDLGYDANHVLTFELAPVEAAYPDAASVRTLSQRLVNRLRQLPGVRYAAAGTNLPAGDFSGQWNIGGLHLPGGAAFDEQFRSVNPGYFATFGIHLRQGRLFARSDVHGGEAVAIVNQAFADAHYGGHALGKTIQQNAFDASQAGTQIVSARIVGVVANTYQFGPQNPASVQPILYLPLAQTPADDIDIFRSYEPMRYAIRVQGNPDGYRDAVKRALAEVAPGQPISHLRSMAWVVRDTTSDTRFNLMLIGLLGSLALLLAGVGMYAVMAVAVAAREREFGVRAALGAAPHKLLLVVLGGGLLQIGLGLLAGVVLGALGSGVLRAVVAQLGRSVFDPWAILAACVVLACAGVLACLVPAVRAGRTAPMRALRGE